MSRSISKKNGIAESDGLTTTTVRVAIYLRISTDEEHQPFSLDAQQHRLKAFISSQAGWAARSRPTKTRSVEPRPTAPHWDVLFEMLASAASMSCSCTGSTASPVR